MKATKRGIIGAIVGGITVPVIYIFSYVGSESQVGVPNILMFILLGAVYGFGYSFGWKYVKKYVAKAFGVATGASLITIIFSRRDTLLKCFFIYMLAFGVAIAVAFIPGIFLGIKSIYQEQTT